MKRTSANKPLVIIQCYEDRQQTLPLRRADVPKEVIKNGDSHLKREATDNPPPPPPMPTTNGHVNGICKTDILKPLPAPADLKAPNFRKNGTLTRTPTPDYNKDSIKTNNNDKAELDSLESYKLKNPSSNPPKPPPNYFMKAPNGTATMKKHTRPVSVTIGEYPYGSSRKEPTKLDFLNGDKVDGATNDEDTSISNRLQSELVLTLSRSNLRKKTEALDRRLFNQKANNIIDDGDTSDLDKKFHARYGNNLLPLPPSITIPKVSKGMKKIAT